MVVKQVTPVPPAPSTASTSIVKEVKSKSGLKCTPVSKHLLFSPPVPSTPSAAAKAKGGDTVSQMATYWFVIGGLDIWKAQKSKVRQAANDVVKSED